MWCVYIPSVFFTELTVSLAPLSLLDGSVLMAFSSPKHVLGSKQYFCPWVPNLNPEAALRSKNLNPGVKNLTMAEPGLIRDEKTFGFLIAKIEEFWVKTGAVPEGAGFFELNSLYASKENTAAERSEEWPTALEKIF